MKLARAFFKHYESNPRSPEVEVALRSLLPAITRFKSLLQVEIPVIRNPDYTPDMVIARVLECPSLKMYIETSLLEVSLRLARRNLARFEDKHAYGLIKDIWMPESLKRQLREDKPAQVEPGHEAVVPSAAGLLQAVFQMGDSLKPREMVIE